MTQWEYKWVSLYRTVSYPATGDVHAQRNAYRAEVPNAWKHFWKETEKLGEDGWELVGEISVRIDGFETNAYSSTPFLVYKRLKAD